MHSLSLLPTALQFVTTSCLFAGCESGHGVGGIPYTIEDMQIDKMAVIKSRGL